MCNGTLPAVLPVWCVVTAYAVSASIVYGLVINSKYCTSAIYCIAQYKQNTSILSPSAVNRTLPHLGAAAGLTLLAQVSGEAAFDLQAYRSDLNLSVRTRLEFSELTDEPSSAVASAWASTCFQRVHEAIGEERRHSIIYNMKRI